ncbi:MAG: hypothetical protein AABY27_03625 [Pseudomonadota bacterium]
MSKYKDPDSLINEYSALNNQKTLERSERIKKCEEICKQKYEQEKRSNIKKAIKNKFNEFIEKTNQMETTKYKVIGKINELFHDYWKGRDKDGKTIEKIIQYYETAIFQETCILHIATRFQEDLHCLCHSSSNTTSSSSSAFLGNSNDNTLNLFGIIPDGSSNFIADK